MKSTKRGRSILVVRGCGEGDALAQCLAEAGFEVEVADGLTDALSKLGSRPYAGVFFSSEAGEAEVVADVSRLSGDVGTPAHVQRETALLDRLTEKIEANLAYLDRDFRFIWVNSTYVEKCGHTWDELAGRSHFDLFPNEENQRTFEQVRDSGIPYEAREKPFVYADQPERGVTYWNWTLTPVKDKSGGVQGLVLSLVDVTADVRARQDIERLRREAEHRTNELYGTFKALADAVVVYDARGVPVQANPAATAAYGFDPVGGDPGKLAKRLRIHHPDGRAVSPDELPSAKALRGEVITDECFIFRGGAGHDRAILASAAPLFGEQGVVGAVSAWHDVTELLRTEEALRAANTQLARVNQDLQQASETQQLVNDISADFLTGASLEHSLKTMLAAARRLVPAEALSIAIFEGKDKLKAWIYDLGDDECTAESERGVGDHFPHMAERYSHGLVINNDGAGLSVPSGHIRLRNLLALGFEVRGGWAHLFLANKEGDFTEQDARKVEVLTRVASIIIDRATLDESERVARAEAERRAAEIESFMSSMADGVSVTDAEGRVIWMNEAGREILGVPPDERFDDWIARYERLTLDGQPLPLEQTVAYRALRGEMVRDFRYRVRTPWDTEVFLSVSASPVRDAQGRVVGTTHVIRDYSKQIEFERQQEQLYEREHRIAQTLQRALIPEATYDVPGCKIVGRYEPALKDAEVGGDFYDVFEPGEGLVGVLIGDVAGKGLPAAIRVAAARHTIRSYAYIDPRPSRAMTRANEALCKDPRNGSGMLTAFFAVVDTRVGTVTYANGGHEPAIAVWADGEIEELSAEGRALGVFPDYLYPEASRRLRPGDRIVMFTDGITEARTSSGLFFGTEGVTSYLSKHEHRSGEELAAGLLDAAVAHSGGSLRDDAAIVVLDLSDENALGGIDD